MAGRPRTRLQVLDRDRLIERNVARPDDDAEPPSASVSSIRYFPAMIEPFANDCPAAGLPFEDALAEPARSVSAFGWLGDPAVRRGRSGVSFGQIVQILPKDANTSRKRARRSSVRSRDHASFCGVMAEYSRTVYGDVSVTPPIGNPPAGAHAPPVGAAAADVPRGVTSAMQPASERSVIAGVAQGIAVGETVAARADLRPRAAPAYTECRRGCRRTRRSNRPRRRPRRRAGTSRSRCRRTRSARSRSRKDTPCLPAEPRRSFSISDEGAGEGTQACPSPQAPAPASPGAGAQPRARRPRDGGEGRCANRRARSLRARPRPSRCAGRSRNRTRSTRCTPARAASASHKLACRICL